MRRPPVTHSFRPTRRSLSRVPRVFLPKAMVLRVEQRLCLRSAHTTNTTHATLLSSRWNHHPQIVAAGPVFISIEHRVVRQFGPVAHRRIYRFVWVQAGILTHLCLCPSPIIFHNLNYTPKARRRPSHVHRSFLFRVTALKTELMPYVLSLNAVQARIVLASIDIPS